MTDFSFPADNAFTGPLVATLKRHPKRIVFPEADDVRVLRVAQELARRAISAPILLGNRDHLRQRAKDEGISLEMVGVIDPEKSDELPRFAAMFETMERYRKMKVSHPEEVMKRPDYFACMMVQYGNADGIVGGNTVYPEAFFRPLFHMIKPQAHCPAASSCMAVVDEQNPLLGENGILFLADCAIIPTPTVEELAMIAVESGRVASTLLGRTARVAMLSYSTRGSAKTKDVERIVGAKELAREHAKQQLVDIAIDLNGTMYGGTREPGGEAIGNEVFLIDPETGVLRDIAERRYRPSAGLDRAVRARDGVCRFPGCNRSAHTARSGTDLDHTIPWPRGQTSAANLAVLCRHHHRLKHSPGSNAELEPDGVMRWTTPSGATVVTLPWAHAEPAVTDSG